MESYENIHRIQRCGQTRTVAVISEDGNIQATSKIMPYGTQPEDSLFEDWKEIVTHLSGATHIAVNIIPMKTHNVMSAVVNADDGIYTIEMDVKPNSFYAIDFADEINHLQ